MASVSAFNDMMSQFLVELHKTFPEEKAHFVRPTQVDQPPSRCKWFYGGCNPVCGKNFSQR